MADIRINALATTAASTASDDYIAIDGSANGTRKLNAYSPTFGGNLTVSGTGSFAGDVDVTKTSGNASSRVYATSTTGIAQADIKSGNGTTSSRLSRIVLRSDETSSQRWDVGLLGTKNWEVQNNTLSGTNALSIDAATNATTLYGNLTVSGGTARFQDPSNSYGVTITTAAAKTLVETLFGGSSLGIRVGGSGSDSLTIASTGATIRDNLTVSGTGNSSVAGTWLIGTTTDSGNGKLQLATHTTSAGGIGFGTDVSLYRNAANQVSFIGGGSAPIGFALASGNPYIFGGASGSFIRFNSGGQIDIITATASSLTLQTNFTTALTLDSSQNATFAGDVTVSGGNMGVGIAASASIALAVTPSTLTGNTQYGVAGYPVFSSAATAAGYSGYFETKTAASAFTMAVGRSIFVEVPTIGAGSAITTQSGIYVSNQGAGSITNAYGIDIAAQSGATTTNIGLRNLGATVLATPAAAVTLATNSTMTFELTSNTSLTIKVRGTDGTTRSVALTLA